jgi:hypothetical protein
LHRKCFLKRIIEEKIEEIGRRGRTLKQLLDEFKKTTRYKKLKEEALDRTVWKSRFGRVYGSVERQITELLCVYIQHIYIYLFSAPVQTGPGAHPASYTIGTGSFPGVKRPGRGLDHPPPSSAEVKERVQLYLYSPSGPLWPVIG